DEVLPLIGGDLLELEVHDPRLAVREVDLEAHLRARIDRLLEVDVERAPVEPMVQRRRLRGLELEPAAAPDDRHRPALDARALGVPQMEDERAHRGPPEESSKHAR